MRLKAVLELFPFSKGRPLSVLAIVDEYVPYFPGVVYVSILASLGMEIPPVSKYVLLFYCSDDSDII